MKIVEDIPAKESVLPLMEAFYTIQGEGAWQGHAAYFVRLAGCDVGCVWCDVKESWNAKTYPTVSIEKIVKEANKHPCKIAVVTGGEPLMYDLTYLTDELKKAGFRTHIETSGVYPLTGQWDWICFSPKKFKKPHESIYFKADELKVIVYNSSDFSFAESFVGLMKRDCKLILQPEWSKQDKMMPLIVDYVKDNPIWQVSLQTHKYMNIP
jgi:organic radical activating enzyme